MWYNLQKDEFCRKERIIIKKLEYIVPKRAWKKLKASAQLQQPVYIYGAATYGKTELIKQFFGKKKYLYYSCANGDILSEIPVAPENSPTILVLDDLSMLREESSRKNVIELAARSDISLFMVSRCSVPEWLFPLYIKSGFIIIEESDLYIDRKTVAEYYKEFEISLSDSDLDFITARVRGNPYAICYVLRRLLEGRPVDESLANEIFDRLVEYTESSIVSAWDSDIAEFLTQLSVVDEFDESLAEFITGNHRVRQLLKKANEIGNFLFIDNDTYTIMAPVLCALRNRAKIAFGNSRLNGYMYNAGLYYETHDKMLMALTMYEKCGSSDRIRELLIRNARQNPGSGYYYELKDYYFHLKDDEIDGNPILMSGISMLYAMMMQEEKSEYWYNKLKEFAKNAKGGEYREAVSRLAYLDVSLTHRGSSNITDILMKAYSINEKNIQLPEFSVTSNIPSIINGGKDFCPLTKNGREFIEKYGKFIEKSLGRYGIGLCDTALAESFYEKGIGAYEILSLLSRAQLQIETDGSPEIQFVCIGLQVRLNLMYGNEAAANELLSGFENRAEKQKFTHLIPNIHALKCRVALFNGDNDTVNNWLSDAPDEDGEFNVMNRYIYLTKVRCYIAGGDYLKAYSLLEKMRYYAEKCKRMYIGMEVNLFSAVVKYRMADNGWKNHLIDCLTTANELAFVRFISEEGAAVLELLENIKKDNEVLNELDSTWFSLLLEETKKSAQKYPMYLKGNVANLPDFSENGLMVLRLQAKGYSISEIAKELAINADTVKYHSKQNYRKLGVSGKTDAVLAARNLGIL